MNSFNTNSLHGVPGPFPLSFDYQRHSARCVSTYASGQSALAIVKILPATPEQRFCLFDVDHLEFDVLTGARSSLRSVLAAADIPFKALDAETLILGRSAIEQALETLPHYNLKVFSIPVGWESSDVEDFVIALPDFEICKLDQNKPIDFFADSHDDCYLSAEFFHDQLAFAQLGALLTDFVSALDEGPAILVPDPICRELLRLTPNLRTTAALCSISGQRRTIGLSTRRAALSDLGALEAELNLVYEDNLWRLS